MLNLDRKACALKIMPEFSDLLDAELNKARGLRKVDDSDPFAEGAVFNFKDPDDSFELGGYHPVEVCINSVGILLYVTDFSYVGKPPFVELAKELDFAFEVDCFGHMGVDYPIAEGAELFVIFQQNFVSYHQSGVFELKVSSL